MNNTRFAGDSLFTSVWKGFVFYFRNNSPVLIVFVFSVVSWGLIGKDSFFIVSEGAGNEWVFDWKFYFWFIALLLFSSAFMILLLTKLRATTARIVYGVIMGVSSVFLLLDLVMTPLKTGAQGFWLPIIVWVDVIIFIIIIYGVLVFSKGTTKIWARNFLVLFAAFSLGRTVALFFSIGAIVIALLFFALYDVFSVFFGPLRKILGKPQRVNPKSVSISLTKEHLDHFTLKICEKGMPVFITKTRIVIGVGDLLFFSVIFSKTLMVGGFVPAIIILVAVIIGHSMTILLVRKISPFPGLPIPIFLLIITLKIMGIF